MLNSRIALVLAAFVVARPLAAQHEGHRAPTLGQVTFPNSGNQQAQEPFLRGVALLHSYEYGDAAEAFRAAERADPSFALAYWMEALTYSHVDWRSEDLAASRAALAKLGATPAARLTKASDDRERLFGAAVEAFYMEGTQLERVRAYADSLRSYAREDMSSAEGMAFASHAVMLQGVVTPARVQRDSLYREAIWLSQRVLTAQPNHPGATHYLIHLYDNPGLAKQGLAFARAYDKIAPDAEHALHMPSHIYLQLGLWNDVVASNERAWAASRRAGRADWHTLSWLQYGYLEQRRFDRAKALIDTARAIVPTTGANDVDAIVVIPRLEFQYAAATGDWTKRLSEPVPPRVDVSQVTDREAGFRRAAQYWLAVDHAMRGDAVLGPYGPVFLAAADSALAGATVAGSRVALANALVIRALVAKSQGDSATHARALRAGADLEKQLEAFIGPPERLFASELLAGELIASGDPAAAAEYYRAVLRLCPGRVESVQGLARSK